MRLGGSIYCWLHLFYPLTGYKEAAMKPKNIRTRSLAIGLIVLVVAMLFNSCGQTGNVTSSDSLPGEKSGLPIDDNLSMQKPLIYENLVVFPVTARETTTIGDFITLDEATEKESVEVTEVGGEDEDGARVDMLTVENKSDKTLILISGELVCGGNQDRIIRHSVVLEPGEKSGVPVRCVESGRWGGERAELQCLKGKSAPAGARAAGQVAGTKGQRETWGEVTEEIKRLKPLNKCITESLGEALDDEQVEVDTKKYFEKILLSLTGNNRIVGIVVAVDGRIVGSDIFCSHEVFVRYAEKLLHSYSVEALCAKRAGEEEVEKDAVKETTIETTHKAVTIEQARDYILTIREGKEENVMQEDIYRVIRKVRKLQCAIGLIIEQNGKKVNVHENTFESTSEDSDAAPDEP
ncbi:MAG: DUF6569 family protein [Planctomycetota bacterium]